MKKQLANLGRNKTTKLFEKESSRHETQNCCNKDSMDELTSRLHIAKKEFSKLEDRFGKCSTREEKNGRE